MNLSLRYWAERFGSAVTQLAEGNAALKERFDSSVINDLLPLADTRPPDVLPAETRIELAQFMREAIGNANVQAHLSVLTDDERMSLVQRLVTWSYELHFHLEKQLRQH